MITRIIFFFVIFSLFVLAGKAREVVIAWDKNPEADVRRYRVYIQDKQSVEKRFIFLDEVTRGETEMTVTIPDGPQTIHLTAVNAQGLESVPSNTLDISTPPSAPSGLRLKITIEIEVPSP